MLILNVNQIECLEKIILGVWGLFASSLGEKEAHPYEEKPSECYLLIIIGRGFVQI